MSSFLDKHGWHLVTAATTVITCLFTLGLMYQGFVVRLERCEQYLSESRNDRAAIRQALVEHQGSQLKDEATLGAKLAKIEADVSWIREAISRSKTAGIPMAPDFASNKAHE